MTTFTSVTPRRAGRELLGQLGQRVALDRHVQDVAVLADHPPRHQLGLAATADRDDPVAVALVQISPRTARPVKRSGRRRNALRFLSMTATVWPSFSSATASSDPTRPQPTTITCTAHHATRDWPRAQTGRAPPGPAPDCRSARAGRYIQ